MAPAIVLSLEDWRQRREAHRERVRSWIEPHRQRRSSDQKHPVLDFLFTYYSFRPSLLERWSPGHSVLLEGVDSISFPWNEFTAEKKGVWLDPRTFPVNRLESVRWIASLLKTTLERPPQFFCFGLHEWAMVYEIEEVRHNQTPLRLPRRQLDEFVRSQTLACSHFDAFRFFTPAATPQNRWQLSRPGQLEHDQSGCIHVNMDLYKWAYKLSPWLPSELVADAFELAWAAREIDMRASPYDLSQLGYAPICIETEEGRREYESAQRAITQRAEPIRRRLLQAYNSLLQFHLQTA